MICILYPIISPTTWTQLARKVGDKGGFPLGVTSWKQRGSSMLFPHWFQLIDISRKWYAYIAPCCEKLCLIVCRMGRLKHELLIFTYIYIWIYTYVYIQYIYICNHYHWSRNSGRTGFLCYLAPAAYGYKTQCQTEFAATSVKNPMPSMYGVLTYI